MNPQTKPAEVRVDFSFKRELFFIVAGALMGAIVMAIPFTFPFTGSGSGYALTWIVFGHIVGIHSPISFGYYCRNINSYSNWNHNWNNIWSIFV